MVRLFLDLAVREGRIESRLRLAQQEIADWHPSEVCPEALSLHPTLGSLKVRTELGAADLRELGILMGAAIPRSVRERLADAISRNGVGLSLHLSPELEDLPWEFLCIDGSSGTFLSRNPAVRFSRRSATQRKLSPSSALKALVAFADPRIFPYGRLGKIEDEFDAVCRALRSDAFSVERLPHATVGQLSRTLSNGHFDIFHFIGHAEQRASGGALILEGGMPNEVTPLYGDELARLLSTANVQLATLSGCLTGAVGPDLTKSGIPAVVAMQMPVSDVVAHLFARSLYTALADGLSLEEAAFEARSAIGGSGEDWGAPVLVTSSPDAPILERRTPEEPATKGNLPKPLNSFVGRLRELTACAELLSSERCVVLIGSGGIGKTRLSIEVGRAMYRSLTHGIWQVQLDSLTADHQVLEAIGLVFGLRATAGQTLEERLIEFLSDRRLLLILDNCEHLLAACRAVVLLILRHCPEVRILATSRELLGTHSEAIVRVPSLSHPRHVDEGLTRMPVDQTIGEFEAVRLLVLRSKSADSGFVVTETDACAFVRIAKRLDGIPLALELAASRIRTLTPVQILERLSNDLAWLDIENPTGVPRHKTLRATLDWSYRLLSAEEKTIFNRLGVFLGGFSLEAAESVAGFGGFGAHEVLRLLSNLVDKSLVVSERVGDRMRYRLLDTCRHYALEELTRTGEEAEIRRRHFDFATALVAEAYAGTFQNEDGQQRAFSTLKTEKENYLAALDWAVSERTRVEESGEMVRRLFHYWYFSRDFELAKRTLTRVLDCFDAREDPLRLKLLTQSGVASVYMGDHSGIDLIEEARSIAERPHPDLEIRFISSWLADAAYMIGHYDTAYDIYERQLIYKRKMGLDDSTSSLMMGVLHVNRNEFEQAERELGVFMDRGERLGNLRDIGHAKCHLANVDEKRGGSAFRRLYAEGIQNLVAVRDEGGLAEFLPMASTAFLPDAPETAAVLQGYAERLREEAGSLTDRLLATWGEQVEDRTRLRLGARYELLRKDGRTVDQEFVLRCFHPFLP